MKAEKRKTLTLWRDNVQEDKRYKPIDINSWNSICQINERISRLISAGVNEKNISYFVPMVQILCDLLKGVNSNE
jgi:hypothetical protein